MSGSMELGAACYDGRSAPNSYPATATGPVAIGATGAVGPAVTLFLTLARARGLVLFRAALERALFAICFDRRAGFASVGLDLRPTFFATFFRRRTMFLAVRAFLRTAFRGRRAILLEGRAFLPAAFRARVLPPTKYRVPRFCPSVRSLFSASSFATGSLSSFVAILSPLPICSTPWPGWART